MVGFFFRLRCARRAGFIDVPCIKKTKKNEKIKIKQNLKMKMKTNIQIANSCVCCIGNKSVD